MNRDKIVEELKRDEGYRMFPYYCTSGRLTIGYGRNIEHVGINEEEAEVLLNNDIDMAYHWLKGNYSWFDGLSDVRKRALVNMVFNLGGYGFTKFKKMIRALAIGHYDRASLEAMDSRWYYQVGDRAKRIVEMIKSG
jgi:lysozyme